MGFWVRISNRRNWWSTEEPKNSEGAPFKLNKYMSRKIFEGILPSLCYIDRKYVEYNYGFFHMHQMEEAWNMNMSEEFNPLWINVLDENMMEWFNKYIPGFMCVGRKPHIFGNERHTIFCGLTSILWRSQIVEGKYRPRLLGQK